MRHTFSLVLITLVSLMFDHCPAKTYTNINCGSSSYTDEYQEFWISDHGFVRNGESKEVKINMTAHYNLVSKGVLRTLRVFPTLKKNCYTIRVEEEEKIQVRASFYYGNYDGKKSPPTFELQFDGNFWATVITSNIKPVHHTSEYVTKGNTTSICIAQILPGQFPFISAIQVWSMGPISYTTVDQNHALSLVRSSKEKISFTEILESAIDVNLRRDYPHVGVLVNAATINGSSWTILVNESQPNHFLGGQSIAHITYKTPLTSSNKSFEGSMIDIYSMYYVVDTLREGTHRNDVEGLEALKGQFDTLNRWTGDPCLPSSFTWEWVECNTDSPPRVTALKLGSFGLSGSVPDFSHFDAIETIDLHNNSLYGSVPEFIGLLPNLKLLNLANNRLNGTIPCFTFNKTLVINLDGNDFSDLSCHPHRTIQLLSPSSNGDERWRSYSMTLAIAALTFLLLFLIRSCVFQKGL